MFVNNGWVYVCEQPNSWVYVCGHRLGLSLWI